MNFVTKKTAFTTAEVLTTLFVIGLIAAFTIPALNTNIEKQKNETMLRKLYSSMSVNIQTVLNQAGVNSLSALRVWNKEGAHNGILANPKYFNVDYICQDCVKIGEIFPAPMNAGTPAQEAVEEVLDADGNITIPAQEGKDAVPANFTTYRLRNGSWAMIYDFRGNCIAEGYVLKNKEAIALCGIVVFDLNESKSPNMPGRDRFAYYISDVPVDNSYLIPIGFSKKNQDNSSSFNSFGEISSFVGSGECQIGSVEGYNCTAKVMIERWKQKY